MSILSTNNIFPRVLSILSRRRPKLSSSLRHHRRWRLRGRIPLWKPRLPRGEPAALLFRLLVALVHTITIHAMHSLGVCLAATPAVPPKKTGGRRRQRWRRRRRQLGGHPGPKASLPGSRLRPESREARGHGGDEGRGANGPTQGADKARKLTWCIIAFVQ